MRILLVSDFYPPDQGGLEGHVARLAAHLAGRGHAVAVATVGAHGVHQSSMNGPVLVGRLPLALERLPVYTTNRAYHPPWPDPAFARALLAMARRFQPDVIHAHGWCEFSAAAVARKLDVPVVVTLHDYGLRCPSKTLRCGDRPCRRTLGLCCLTCWHSDQGLFKRTGLAASIRLGRNKVAGRISRFLAVSHYVARAHLYAGIGEESDYRVVPNFVDTDLGTATDGTATDGTATDGTATDGTATDGTAGERSILFVGPDTPRAGRAVLEAAHRALPADRPALRLVDSDATAEPSAGHGIDPGVDPGAGPDAYRPASMVVVPSLWPDPCPTVALEAMAAARPVIASAVGGLTDIVEPGVTGMLVPPGDVNALADALRALTGDATLAAKLGAAGRDRVVEQFSAEAVIPRIEAAYQEVRA